MFRTIVALISLVVLLPGCPTDGTGNNQPPEIRLDVPATFNYVVGEGRITITATAADPEGSSVSIGVVNQPARATVQLFDGWAVFDWDPLASDVTPAAEPLNLIFFAEDASGGRSERVVSISIRAGNGIPRFENSPSVLYNTDSGKPLIFEVRVRDDDSIGVAIAMPTALAPPGAGYTRTGDFSGRFEWLPTPQELEFRVHSVTFTADDGQNPTVTQKVSILFKKSGGGTEEPRPEVPENPTDPTSCGYEDQVLHQPIGAQRGAASYRVEATLSAEAAARYDRLVLNWTDQDAYNDFDIQMEGMEMATEGAKFVGLIPNPILAAGQSRVFYYEICAIDDDSSDDDAILCGPSSIYHSFIAYSPNDLACGDDVLGHGSFETALDLSTVAGWRYARACSGVDDFYRMELGPMQEADLFFTYPFGSNTTVQMLDGNRAPLPFEASSCSGFGYAFVENTTDQPITRYFRLSGNEVPYQFSPHFYTPTTMCVATDIEPNDTAPTATPITPDGTATPMQEICGVNDVDVFKFRATMGQEITARATFIHANGDVDIKLFAPSLAATVGPNASATVSGLSVTDNELIQRVAAETGDYYLLVRGYQASNTYTASVSVSGSCTDDDSFGNNHTLSTAANMSAFTPHRGLKVCSGADDWYAFQGFAGEYIDVTLRVTSGNASAVTMTVLLEGFPETTGTLAGDTISSSVDVTSDAMYQVQVSTTQAVDYELTIEPFSI